MTFEPLPRMGSSCCTRKNGLRTFCRKEVVKILYECNTAMRAALLIPALKHKHIQIDRLRLRALVSPAAQRHSGVPKSPPLHLRFRHYACI